MAYFSIRGPHVMSDVVGTLEQSLGGTANLPTENDPGTAKRRKSIHENSVAAVK